MAGLTLLRVASNSDIDRREQEREAHNALIEQQNQPVMLGMMAYLRECWEAARMAKKPIHDEMLMALRQRTGEYEPSKLSQIRQHGGSEVFMMITEVKCRAAESWLRDILLSDGSPPWDLAPTPIPDLPPEVQAEIVEAFGQKVVETIQLSGQAPSPDEMLQLREMVAQDFRFRKMQEAQNRVDRMSLKIQDQFVEGGWPEAFNDFVTDLVTYPAAFLKGPVIRRRKRLAWGQSPETGRIEAVADESLVPEFERVSPFNIYPEPGITHPDDGYMFEYHEFTRTDLADLIGVPNYDEEALRALLREGPQQSWIIPDLYTQKDELENKYHTTMRPTDVYDGVEFWGRLSGNMLIEWGIPAEEIDDPEREYDSTVLVIGPYIVKAVLNHDPLGESPYSKTSYIKTPGSFWGKGIPEIIRDVQNVCNATARALVNNMGVSSGPQVEVNLDRVPPNEDITQMFPWKIWQTLNDPMGSSAPAVRFSQPDSRADELMRVYEYFSKLADDHSGIPAYIYGDTDVKGAGRTSSGLSMLMGAAGKGIAQVVGYIDSDIIKPIVHRQFIFNMRFDEDESIKGDAQIVARGATNLANREIVDARRLEFLNFTGNPVDMEIIGVNGRAALLREVAKGLKMPIDEIVPSKEKLAHITQLRMQSQQMQQEQEQQGPAPREANGEPQGGQAGNLLQAGI